MKKYVAGNDIGTLYLAKLDDEDLKPYRKNIVEYADTLEDVSKRAFEAFETLSKHLNVAREKSKIYATGLKDKNKQKQPGTDALKAMTAAKDWLIASYLEAPLAGLGQLWNLLSTTLGLAY